MSCIDGLGVTSNPWCNAGGGKDLQVAGFEIIVVDQALNEIRDRCNCHSGVSGIRNQISRPPVLGITGLASIGCHRECREINLAGVVNGLRELTTGESAGDCGKGKRRNRRDDRDNNEHFDKGKSSVEFLRHLG